MMKTTLAIVVLLAGCPGGRECGAPHDAGPPGIQATVGGTSFGYGEFVATHARDCGLASTTIDGRQVSPTPEPFRFTICVLEGDRIDGEPLSFDDPQGMTVDLVDVNARDAAGCTYAIDFAATPTGTLSFQGYCDQGGHGFLMTVDGSVAGFRTCAPDPPEPMTIELTGTADVAFPAP